MGVLLLQVIYFKNKLDSFSNDLSLVSEFHIGSHFLQRFLKFLDTIVDALATLLCVLVMSLTFLIVRYLLQQRSHAPQSVAILQHAVMRLGIAQHTTRVHRVCTDGRAARRSSLATATEHSGARHAHMCRSQNASAQRHAASHSVVDRAKEGVSDDSRGKGVSPAGATAALAAQSSRRRVAVWSRGCPGVASASGRGATAGKRAPAALASPSVRSRGFDFGDRQQLRNRARGRHAVRGAAGVVRVYRARVVVTMERVVGCGGRRRASAHFGVVCLVDFEDASRILGGALHSVLLRASGLWRRGGRLER